MKQLQKQSRVDEDEEEPLLPSQRVNFAAQESKDNKSANSTMLSVRGSRNNVDDDEDEDDAFLRRKFNSRQLLTSPGDHMSGKQDEEDSESAVMDFDIKAHPSESIPLIDFLKGGTEDIKICGMCVLRDPFAGHTVLFRTFSTTTSSPSGQPCEVWAVNLTVHATLCELFKQQASRAADRESVCRPIQEALRVTASEQAIRWKQAQKIISEIAAGLKNMPQVLSTLTGYDRVVLLSESSKVLRQAQQQQHQLQQQEIDREGDAHLSDDITKAL
jgi:hypothetical protein